MDKKVIDSCTISAIHPDIIHEHILTRLDGPTLAAMGTASCQLRALSNDDSLWGDICHRAWPSTTNPRLRHLIASFPSGYRSFYADSYFTLHCKSTTLFIRDKWSQTLMSAVDIHYKKNKNLLSKVQETDTKPRSWSGSPFYIELLAPGESLPIPGKLDIRDPNCESELENNLTLSWILIDPIGTRAANLTNCKPVCMERDWSTGDVEVHFGTVLCGERKGELVECAVVVTCGGWGKDDLHVKQVRLEIEDAEGNKLGWRECMVILQEAMENGDRTKGGEMGAYDEFIKMKAERKERKLKSERRQEEVGICTGAIMVIGFWVFATVWFFHLLSSYFLFTFSWNKVVESMY